jgi:TRAP-type mannitol/chloroaromatic compound transport system substrate-binding protein
MKSNRRKFITGAAGAAAATIAAPAIAQSLPEVRWRCASSFPKSLDTIYGGAEVIAKRVAAITNGKFQIRPFGAGEIVPAFGTVDAVQQGTVECTHTASYYFVGKNKTFAFDTTVPFGMNQRQQNAWIYWGGGLQLMREFFRDFNIISFPAGNTGCQMGGWFRKEVTKVADLKGLKMRIAGLGGEVMARLGAVPQQIAGGDIYPALERGTIDAAEWVGPYDDEKLGFAKVAKYYYYPGFWEGGPMVHAFANLEKWNALPKSYQAILTNATANANTWMNARYDMLNPGALKRLVAGGTQLRPFTNEVLEACLKATNELWGEISAKNPDFKKSIDAMQAYRSDQYLWWQVAEYTFDSFMIRSRTRG